MVDETNITIKEHFYKLLEMYRSDHAREHALEAERANEKFLDANRVRAQIDSERGTFVNRAEYAAAHKIIEIQINALEKRNENLEGRLSGTAATVAIVLIVVQIAIGIFLHFVK
jgi:hypothetical protein